MSLLLVPRVSVDAQTLETLTHEKIFFGETPQILVGYEPSDIQVNRLTNKIYVANELSGTVIVIDGKLVKVIPV